MRGQYLDHISRHLGTLSSRVRMNSKAGRVNIDVDTEMTVCGLLNMLEGWELNSLNEETSNFPGIDLEDRKNGIAVQVTATATGHKINHTLTEFINEGFEKSFSRLIVVIINDKKCPEATERVSGGFHFKPSRDIWNLSTIFDKAKVLPSAEKLKEISLYLNDELGYIPIGPRYPLPGVPRASGGFLQGSRDRELEKLEKMVSPDCPVFLWGLGGIGKTEAAIQLAKRVEKDRRVYFLNYCSLPDSSEAETMRETILQANFAGYHFRGEDNDKRDAEYRARMDMLRTDYAGTMLIIDNFDRDGRTLANLQSEPAYRELTTMGICLVFTTRNQVKDGCEIKPLGDEYLLELMRKNLETVDVAREDLLDLIRAVDGHTLMVLLMAKTLEESWGDISPEQLLQALKKSKLNQKNFPEVVSDQNQSYEQRQIYAHIKALFDLSGLNQTDHTVLRCATLLPEEGMLRNLFLTGLPKEQHQSLRNLISRGWLHLEKNLLTIHPVIRDVCREEMQLKDQNCKDFLWALYSRYKPKKYDVSQIWQVADCMTQAADILEDSWGDWSYNAAYLWGEIGQLRTALHYAEQSVQRRQIRANRRAAREIKMKRSRHLASAYNMAALAYSHIGNHEKSRMYGEEALKLRKQWLPKDDPQIAASYNNLGMTYSHLGLYQKGLDYLWIAVRMREAQEKPRLAEIANSYNNIGTTYNSMGKYSNALRFREKALEIRREIFAEDPSNPDLATSINNVGRTLHELGRYDEALEKELEALNLRKGILHGTDSDLANSYYNVGHTYGAKGDYPKAVYHLEQALYTWEMGKAEDNMYYASTKEELEEYRKQLSPQGV